VDRPEAHAAADKERERAIIGISVGAQGAEPSERDRSGSVGRVTLSRDIVAAAMASRKRRVRLRGAGDLRSSPCRDKRSRHKAHEVQKKTTMANLPELDLMTAGIRLFLEGITFLRPWKPRR
jgi:hypothetical protein